MNLKHDADDRGERADESPRSTAAFPSVLIALIALGLMTWVGVKLLQPSPAPPVTSKSAASAASAQELHESTLDAAGIEATSGMSDTVLSLSESDPICGMNPQRSAMRVEAKFEDGSLAAFDSLACYFEYVETMTESAPVAERIVAFDTYRLEHPVLLEFGNAVWLIDLDGNVPGAMPPGAAAFRTVEDAEKAMGNLGGKLASTSEMKAYIHEYLRENGILN